MAARFEGKVAISTGAANGFGRAVAQKLLAEGAKVVLVDWDGDALAKTAAELGAAGTDAACVTSVVADVSSEADVDGYVDQAVETYGRIDLFFNNAGIEGKLVPMVELDVADYDRVMAINARGVFMGLRAVLKVMKAQGTGGSIVCSSSQAGIKGSGRFSAYVASKHAVIGLSRSAALEGAAYGVRVNAVAPGLIDTRMLRNLATQIDAADPDGVHDRMTSQVPLGRLGTADDVADLVAWLLSDDSSYISGTIQVIDGALNA